MRSRFVSALVAAALTALAAPAAHAEEASDAKQIEGSYLRFETLVVNVVRPSGRRGSLTVEIGVDAPDPALLDRVVLSRPILRAAFISALQSYALGLAPGSPPSADYISMALQRAADQALRRRGARVLLGSILLN